MVFVVFRSFRGPRSGGSDCDTRSGERAGRVSDKGGRSKSESVGLVGTS